MIKKIILLAAALALSSTVWAQDANTTATPDPGASPSDRINEPFGRPAPDRKAGGGRMHHQGQQGGAQAAQGQGGQGAQGQHERRMKRGGMGQGDGGKFGRGNRGGQAPQGN